MKKMKSRKNAITILIVDDDKHILNIFSQMIRLRGYEPLTAQNGKQALDILSKKNVNVVITDVRMPEMNGMELLTIIKKKYPDTDVIVITGYASTDDAVKAMKCGASDYILKPFSPDEVLLKVMDIYNKNKSFDKEKQVVDRKYHIPVVVADTKGMKQVLQEVDIVSPTDAVVLITGETGVGKDVIARLLHTKSERRMQPFIRMNCVELNEGVIESELFGHEKGEGG